MNPLHRLPPLNALRAFEAVARHSSFARAAEELHVTKAAVAQQVRALEQEIGARLVERNGPRASADGSGRGRGRDARGRICAARQGRARDARGQGAPLPHHQFGAVVRRDLACRPDRQVQGAPSRDRRADRRQSDRRRARIPAPPTRSSAGARASFPASRRRFCSRRTCFRSARRNSSPATIRCASPEDLARHTPLHLDWNPAHRVLAHLVRLAQGGGRAQCRGHARRLLQQHGDDACAPRRRGRAWR